MAPEDSIDTGAITSRLRALAADAPLSIVVVDDDELERALIADRLSRRGFEVRTAADGAEALAVLDKQPSPVILVDWSMPIMDGIELTEQLRAKGISDTYIIMLTAKDSEFDFQRGYAAGVDDYLSKKVREPELLARVHAAFNTFKLRRELRDTRAALAEATKHR